MPNELRVDWDTMVSSAKFIAEQAVQLSAELDGIEREWDSLSATWLGDAASSYASPWQQWHEGADRVARALEESCDLLRQAATAYVAQDNDGAQPIADITQTVRSL
ncbi:WXG100 family type VII secretion target [Mycobacterium sp. URHD0025]|uniref:WXG100 family type VII secretion target n=1 Tax=Mycobacterium sp. URHD0025 TaxID=1298864 RepID=UPI0012DFDF27|nr:WXG100 family type VII secretion target [Mycobacterium sp. URHD0025]